MAITYIAFIECVLETEEWFPRFYSKDYDPTLSNKYTASADKSHASVVDITGLRRYFEFHRDAKVYVVNNVLVYESDTVEELAVDDSKKFPNKKRIDE